MTPGAAPPPSSAAPLTGVPAPAPVVHSAESQWALIWREFSKRKIALVSLYVIILLITLSVAAPFLANDRPLHYRGYNRFEYREALRTLLVVMNAAAEPRRKPTDAKPPSGKPEEKKPAPEPTAVVLARQFDVMERQVGGDFATELRAARDKALAIVGSASADNPLAPEAAAQLKALRIEIRKKFERPDVPFVANTHWPVFASLDWGDATLLAMNISLLLLPAWLPLMRRIVPAKRDRLRTLVLIAMFFGLPAVAGLAWKLAVPERLDRTHYKEGAEASSPEAAKAPVVYESVTWPLIPYGLDEGDLDRKYARPALARYVPDSMLGIWSNVPEDTTPDGKPVERTPGRYDGPNWLGTDGTGRDILCRMLWGGRVSLSVGIVATLIELALGITLGALAGYFRGWVDVVLSRLIEIVICFPSFFLILTIVAFVGPSIYNIMVIIGLTGWTGIARLVRGEFLRLADQEFVLSARSLGYSPARIIFLHVLPNAIAPVLVTATFAVAGAILIESGLSFLGLGITVPKPSWGGILSTGRDSLFRAPWIIYFPGLALFVTITAYNLVGEAFRDASDPRLRGRV